MSSESLSAGISFAVGFAPFGGDHHGLALGWHFIHDCKAMDLKRTGRPFPKKTTLFIIMVIIPWSYSLYPQLTVSTTYPSTPSVLICLGPRVQHRISFRPIPRDQ